MSLAITTDQIDLRDTMRQFLANESPLTRVRETMSKPAAYDQSLWSRLTKDFGLPGLAVPARYGGLGFDLQALSYVAEECGRALAPGPLISTCGLAIPLLLACDDEAKQSWLSRLIRGEIGAVAWPVSSAAWDRRNGAFVAEPEANSVGRWRVQGSAAPILDGGVADVLLVVADTNDGPAIVAIDGASAGVMRSVLPGLDQTRGLGHVEIENASGVVVSTLGGGAELIRSALNVAAVVLAAEMVGGAQACLEMSVEYAKVRYQFGRPIGSFQAIKHKCAENLVEIEGARAAARYAAWCAVEDPSSLPTAATVAKSAASKAFFRAAADNVQIHGGVGFTWEHDAHLYLKRAKVSKAIFGNVRAYRRRLADLINI